MSEKESGEVEYVRTEKVHSSGDVRVRLALKEPAVVRFYLVMLGTIWIVNSTLMTFILLKVLENLP